MFKQLLQGRPFGHPLHPIIVHLPIGLFFISLLLDIASQIGPTQHALVSGAMWCIGLGLVGSLLAAAPGLADYLDIRADHPARNTATTHMLLNLAAVVLYAIDFALRWRLPDQTPSTPALPLILSIVGVAIISYSGYLGGILVYDQGIAVGRHRCKMPLPRETIDVTAPATDGLVDLAPANLQEGQTLRANVHGIVLAVIRHQDQYYAVQEFCTHRFGPLSEGELCDGKVICPWHQSQFDVNTGKVAKGPAKVDLKHFDVVVQDGRIKLRMA